MAGNKHDIHERIFKFVVDVIKFVNTLSNTQSNKVITYQILKSVMSIGANDQEADGASSRKDFVHKYGIVRKEGKETNYWLRLIGATNIGMEKKSAILKEEGEEIVAIVSKIITNANITSARNKKSSSRKKNLSVRKKEDLNDL